MLNMQTPRVVVVAGASVVFASPLGLAAPQAITSSIFPSSASGQGHTTQSTSLPSDLKGVSSSLVTVYTSDVDRCNRTANDIMTSVIYDGTTFALPASTYIGSAVMTSLGFDKPTSTAVASISSIYLNAPHSAAAPTVTTSIGLNKPTSTLVASISSIYFPGPHSAAAPTVTTYIGSGVSFSSVSATASTGSALHATTVYVEGPVSTMSASAIVVVSGTSYTGTIATSTAEPSSCIPYPTTSVATTTAGSLSTSSLLSAPTSIASKEFQSVAFDVVANNAGRFAPGFLVTLLAGLVALVGAFMMA